MWAHTNQSQRKIKKRGFTIVELLIVIVIIGILAAVVIVAYAGIKGRVIDSSMKVDLQNAAKLLSNDFTVNAQYPATVAAANSGKGLPTSNGSTYSYTVNNVSTPPVYGLVITNSGSSNSYTISSTNTTPKLVAGSSDNFNRTDASTLGTASSGQLWSVLSGSHWYIAGNRVSAGDGSGSSYYAAIIPSGISDATVSVDCIVAAAMDQGLALRAQDDNNYLFVDVSGDGAGNYVTRTFRKTGTSFTPLTSLITLTGLSPGMTLTMKAVMSGTSITVYANKGTGDVQVGQISVSTGLESQTAHGIVISAGQINNLFDNFLVQ